MFESALDQESDVMVLAGINWSGVPLPVRRKILKKVEDGTPLVMKASQPDELLEAATATPAPIEAEWACPYAGIPAFAGYATHEAWLEGVLQRRRHGKGDIWMLGGYDVPDYQLLTPGPGGAEGGEIRLVEYDYCLALIVHLLREAAGVKPPVRVQGQGRCDVSREAPQPLAFRLLAEKPATVTCVWTVRDRENRVWSVAEETVALKAGENRAVHALDELSGGEYFVDLQVKADGKVLDFGSAFVTVKSADRIESVAVEESGAGAVKGRIKLSLTGQPQGLSVRVRRRDNCRRPAGEAEAPVQRDEVAFALPAAETLSQVQYLDVELTRGQDVLDRRTVAFRAEGVPEADRHAVWPKGAGAGSYLAEYLRAGYERAGAGLVLNNFVTELLNVAEFPGQGTDAFSFELPRTGWVHIRAEATGPGPAWIRLGSEQEPATVLTWPGDASAGPERETMRFLEPGRYRLYAAAEGATRFRRLVVRSVPHLIYNPYPTHLPRYANRPKVDWDFLKRHVLPSVNVVSTAGLLRGRPTAPPVEETTEWKRRGGKWFVEATVPNWPPDSDVMTVDEVFRYWTSGELEMGCVDGLGCDEFTIAHLPKQQKKFEVYCEAIRRISQDPAFRGKAVYPYIGLGNSRFFKSTLRHIAEIGFKVQAERYLYEPETRDEAVRLIVQLYDLDMEPFLEVNPEPQRHILHFYCPNTDAGVDMRPDVDFKVFLDMQFNYLANAPACAGLYGLGPWTCVYADEETIRWLGKLYRHYCIEGRRDLLATDPYELTHIRNGDFADGLQAWEASAAEDGGIRIAAVPGLSRIEGRMYLGDLPGADQGAAMRRSAKGPNRLTQRIENLTPGRLYSLSFYTYDPAGERRKPHAVAATIDPAETPHPLASRAVSRKLSRHFMIFRASAPTAALCISDWRDSSEPGGEPGQELHLDFVQVQPYLPERPE